MAREAATPVAVPPGAPPMDADLAEWARRACTWCGHTEVDKFPGERGCEWSRCQQCRFWRNSFICDPHDYAVDDYDLAYFTAQYGQELDRKDKTSHYRFRVIEAMCPNKGTFVDIGASYGYMLKAGTERGWTTHGVDIAPAAIEFAKERGLDTRLGSLTDIPFEANSMDVVHARHVLEHDVQTYRALAEIKRVLKPGGLLVCEVPNAESKRGLSETAKQVAKWQYYHMVCFTPSVLSGFMGRAGLRWVPEPSFVPGPPVFLGWRWWKRLRESQRWATYMVTFWRKPA